MEALWNAVKSLSAWQVIFLALVLFGSGAAVFYIYTDTNQQDTSELADNQQLIPIRYGDIVNQVSTNGNLDFPERETVSFAIDGTLGEVLVEKGHFVSQGEALARMDSSTVTTLEEAVAQAEVDLLLAEDALAELLERPSEATMTLDRAAAREGVSEARFQLQQAHEALEELLDPVIPTFLEVKTVKERIAATELLIEQREEEREDLLNPLLPTDQEIKAQEELIADARVKLQEAIDSRDELLTRNLQPDFEMKRAEALQKRADAEKELAAIGEALEALEPSERELVEAYQDRLKAQIAVDEVRQAIEDFLETQGSDLSNRRREKETIEVDLSASLATLASLREGYDQGTLGLASNIRRWETYVENLEKELQEVRFGIVSEIEEMEAALLVAETTLKEPEDRLAELSQGPDSLERAALEARAEAIVANQEVVERDLAELEEPQIDQQELALREARIVLAKATLNQAIADLAELLEALGVTPNKLELELNTQQLELAQATLAQYREDYEQMIEDRKAQPDPLEVALYEQKILVAEAALAQAQQELEGLIEEQQQPPDPVDVASAEQKILSVNIRLTLAREELASVAIVAPISGYVAEVLAETGDEVEPRTEILEIVDPTIVEVDGIVDEIDVLLVQVGTPAEVSLDALPGVTIDGIVTEIAEQSQNQQGVVSFPIRIRMEMPERIQPRAGLSAVANIVLREERNVLLVPQQALYGSFDQPVVRVVTDLGVAEQPVTLGSSDDFWVAVREGLSEGDQVVLEGAEVSTGESGFRNLRRATGGGFGGPRGGGRTR